MWFPTTICYSPFSCKKGRRPRPWARTRPVLRSTVRFQFPLSQPCPCWQPLPRRARGGAGGECALLWRGRHEQRQKVWYTSPLFLPRALVYSMGWGRNLASPSVLRLRSAAPPSTRRGLGWCLCCAWCAGGVRVCVDSGRAWNCGSGFSTRVTDVALRTVLMLYIHLRRLYCVPFPQDRSSHSSLVHVRCISTRCFSCASSLSFALSPEGEGSDHAFPCVLVASFWVVRE